MPLKAGSAFFLESTGGFANPAGQHLFVCLTNPDEKGDLLSVSVMTYRAGMDASCLLDVGEHNFLRHRSCVNYARANKIYGKGQENSPLFTPADTVSDALLKKIQDGLFASGDTPEFVLSYAKKRGLKPPEEAA